MLAGSRAGVHIPVAFVGYCEEEYAIFDVLAVRHGAASIPPGGAMLSDSAQFQCASSPVHYAACPFGSTVYIMGDTVSTQLGHNNT